MNTLFIDDKDNMIIQIGNGIGIKETTNKIIVYRTGIQLKETEFKSGLDKRVLVVDLVEKYGVSKMKLSKALNISQVLTPGLKYIGSMGLKAL